MKTAEEQIKEFLGTHVHYDCNDQRIWANQSDGRLQMIADLRGWGAIQNMFIDNKGVVDLKAASQFQDLLGEFISKGINAKLNADQFIPKQEGKCTMTEMDKARFWIKVNQTDYCWNWTGHLNNCGYGAFRMDGTVKMAHRVSYYIVYGEFSDQILHKCDNPACVNPTHLFVGTHQDNMNDKMNKGRGRMQGRSSVYLGVGFRNDSNSWRANCKINKKLHHIGCFATEKEAAYERNKYIIANNIDDKLNDLPSPPLTDNKQKHENI